MAEREKDQLQEIQELSESKEQLELQLLDLSDLPDKKTFQALKIKAEQTEGKLNRTLKELDEVLTSKR